MLWAQWWTICGLFNLLTSDKQSIILLKNVCDKRFFFNKFANFSQIQHKCHRTGTLDPPQLHPSSYLIPRVINKQEGGREAHFSKEVIGILYDENVRLCIFRKQCSFLLLKIFWFFKKAKFPSILFHFLVAISFQFRIFLYYGTS